MPGRIDRRRLAAWAAGALAAGRARAVGAQEPAATAEPPVTPLEQCSWRRNQGPLCRGGSLKENWCERCCDPTGCQVVRCEWRVVGTC